MTRLILFDIDGTLLHSHGAAGRPFRAALEREFGTSGPENGYSFAGRTDPEIAGDLLRMAGVEEARIQDGLPRVWESYLEGLERELLDARIDVLPGVHALLERLESAADLAVLALLTGNLREGARLKLEAARIGFQRFQLGAFGSDHADRRELPAVAIQRAEQQLGRRFGGKEVVIIGDTPADIACGEHLGVRTLAVSTGSYDRAELERCGPDRVFDTLEDTDAVWEAIFR